MKLLDPFRHLPRETRDTLFLLAVVAWVLLADDQGLDYGLRLPGVEIKPASGAAQRLRCLEALATC